MSARGGGRRGTCPLAEPLEERVLMALAKAGGGSGYSANLSTNPTIRQQQLICDPDEPLEGSTSVSYDATKVTLRDVIPGPGYTNQFFQALVEVQDAKGNTLLQPLQAFKDRPAGIETGFLQTSYQLTGDSGQLPVPDNFRVVDDTGVQGVDTHAARFELLKDVPDDAIVRYNVFAAPENTHSGNKGDYLMTTDGIILGPDQLSAAPASTRPDLDTTISVGDLVTSEDAAKNPASILIGLSRAAAGPVTVSYEMADGSAKGGADYEPAGGVITFAPGETSKRLPIGIIDDGENEPVEAFFVKFFKPTGASLEGGADVLTSTVVIADNDAPPPPPVPTVSVSDASADEGDAAGSTATFVLRLSNPYSLPVTVDYLTLGHSATAGVDFGSASGSVTFSPGQTEQPVGIVVNGDTLDEADETFFLRLAGATNATIGDGLGVGTILEDDDHPPTATLTPALPASNDLPVDEVRIDFSDPVRGFDLSDLTFTRNGTPVPLDGATLTNEGTAWFLRGLSRLNTDPGEYGLLLPAVRTSDITDLAFNPLAAGDDANWSVFRRGVPPVVTQVFVAGSSWTPAYRNYLATQKLGEAPFGFAIPTGTTQLKGLPWGQLNQVSVRFDKDVLVLDSDLEVHGVNVPKYDVKSMDYDDATHTATFTLTRPVLNDKLLLDLNGDADGVVDADNVALDGDWVNGRSSYPSGDGRPGGSFRFGVNVLAGDVNGDGKVTYFDWLEIRRRLGRSVLAPGPAGSPTSYGPFYDISGDGVIGAFDLLHVRRNLLNTPPAGEPGTATLAGRVGTASITQDLFGSDRAIV